MSKHPKRPRDPSQLAKFVVDLASGELDDITTTEGKNPAAVALGRLGGLRGGIARAASLSSDDRSRIAAAAAQARWGKKKKK